MPWRLFNARSIKKISIRITYFFPFDKNVGLQNTKKKRKRGGFLDYEEYPPRFRLASPKSAQLVIQKAAICSMVFSLIYFVMA